MVDCRAAREKQEEAGRRPRRQAARSSATAVEARPACEAKSGFNASHGSDGNASVPLSRNYGGGFPADPAWLLTFALAQIRASCADSTCKDSTSVAGSAPRGSVCPGRTGRVADCLRVGRLLAQARLWHLGRRVERWAPRSRKTFVRCFQGWNRGSGRSFAQTSIRNWSDGYKIHILLPSLLEIASRQALRSPQLPTQACTSFP